MTLPLLTLLVACGADAPAPHADGGGAAPTNRIHTPAEVVANLGITFRRAEQGRLELRMEVPGRLEGPEDRRWSLRAPAAGRVRLAKERWAEVVAGERIGELISDELRAVQAALFESRGALLRAERELEQARAGLEPLRALAQSLADSLESTRERVQGSGTVAEQAEAVRTAARERLAEVQRLRSENAISGREFLAAQQESLAAVTTALDAQQRLQESRIALRELEQRSAEIGAQAATSGKALAALELGLQSARMAYRHKLRELAALTGVDEATLDADDAWAEIRSLALVAPANGMLVELHTADGEWVEASSVLAVVVDTSMLVFRGELPEGDLARLPPGAPVRVVSPVGAFPAVDTTLIGPLPLADPDTRTVRVEARVPNADQRLPRGISAQALVLVDRGEHDEVLVPADCIVQDQLEFLVFRRDPADAEYVIRTPVALGRRTRQHVEVLSGVAPGDEVVADGIHQLKQTGVGRPSASGHFHADGSWHDAEE